MKSAKKQVMFNLRKALINEMKDYSKKTGYTYSEFVTRAIEEKLKREKDKEDG